MISLYFSVFLLLPIGFATGQLNISYVGRPRLVVDCDECCQQYKALDEITNQKMTDASSDFKFSGLLYGNFWDLGSYDECLSIQNREKETFGKYCLGYSSFEQSTAKENSDIHNILELVRSTKKKLKKMDILQSDNPSISGLHAGLCVPNKCSVQYLAQKYPTYSFNEELCYTRAEKSKIPTEAVIALTIIVSILVIAIISTIYDLVYEYKDMGQKHMGLVAFSMYTNGKILFKISKNPNQLLCINGIKAITMMWVILGHVYYNFSISVAMTNFAYVFDWIDNPANMIVMSAALSVDTFFVIGGLLLVYTSMKAPKMELTPSIKELPLTYLNRYIRLTPALAIMVLLYATGLVTYISDGPRWGTIHGTLLDSCEKNWWATLLYIQNYDGVDNLCVSQSWYLSVDMQLFVIAHVLLIVLRQRPKWGISVLVFLVLLANIIMFIVGYTNEITGLGKGSILPINTSDYYYMTHVRFGPYVIGMLMGYYIYEMKNRKKPLKLSTWSLSLLWVVISMALLSTIFGGFMILKKTDNAIADGFFFCLNRHIWSSAVGLLIILCVFGKGGPINWFLSLPIFQLITKLSYSIYLIHYIVISVGNLTSRDATTFSDLNAVFQFFAYSAITILLSVLYCLVFEYPTAIIWKMMFGKPRGRKTETAK